MSLKFSSQHNFLKIVFFKKGSKDFLLKKLFIFWLFCYSLVKKIVIKKRSFLNQIKLITPKNSFKVCLKNFKVLHLQIFISILKLFVFF